MTLKEVYVLYSITEDAILSVHSSNYWAEVNLNSKPDSERNKIVIATLQEGIDWACSSAKQDYIHGSTYDY